MRITQVITTFNRGSLLRASLHRLATLTLPDEILVIDDGGSDDTEQVCADYTRDGLPIRYVYNDNPHHTICSMARNIGLKLASHPWVVTSEPELIYVTDVIRQFKRLAWEHPQSVISAGRIWFLRENSTFPLPDVSEVTEDWNPPVAAEGAVGWVAPYTALYHRDWLMAVGGWDEEFPGPWGWDDTDLLTRLRFSGHGQHIALGVLALHQHHGGSLGDQGGLNERHFLRKGFHSDSASDLIANKEREWGVLHTPSS